MRLNEAIKLTWGDMTYPEIKQKLKELYGDIPFLSAVTAMYWQLIDYKLLKEDYIDLDRHLRKTMPDVRLIDANALLQECEKAYNFEDRRGQLSHCISAIKTAPTIDAQPVKHGKWLDVSFSVGEYHGDTEDTENIEITITSGKCSECGRYSYRLMQYSVTIPKYCSHCGRMMENGKD